MTQPRLSRRSSQGRWAELALTIRVRRAYLGLTQRDAADLAGLSERALRAIEGGDVSPGLDALSALAEALGLDLVLVPRGVIESIPRDGVWLSRKGAE